MSPGGHTVVSAPDSTDVCGTRGPNSGTRRGSHPAPNREQGELSPLKRWLLQLVPTSPAPTCPSTTSGLYFHKAGALWTEHQAGSQAERPAALCFPQLLCVPVGNSYATQGGPGRRRPRASMAGWGLQGVGCTHGLGLWI